MKTDTKDLKNRAFWLTRPKNRAHDEIAMAAPQPSPTQVRFDVTVKAAEGRTLAGWAYVTHDPDGQQQVDHSGEFIDDPEVLRRAFHGLVKAGGQRIDVGHNGDYLGQIVAAVVFTPETLNAMAQTFGQPITGMPYGAWIEIEVPEEVHARVRSGKLKMLSIEGLAMLEDAEPAEAAA